MNQDNLSRNEYFAITEFIDKCVESKNFKFVYLDFRVCNGILYDDKCAAGRIDVPVEYYNSLLSSLIDDGFDFVHANIPNSRNVDKYEIVVQYPTADRGRIRYFSALEMHKDECLKNGWIFDENYYKVDGIKLVGPNKRVRPVYIPKLEYKPKKPWWWPF